MKTVFRTVLMFAAFAAVFTACKKDEPVNAPDSLVGTSWLLKESTTQNGVTITVGVEINFETATKGNVAFIVGGKSQGNIAIAGYEAGNFTYSYAKPKVTITIDGEKSTGTIDGNKLTLDGEVFTKE